MLVIYFLNAFDSFCRSSLVFNQADDFAKDLEITKWAQVRAVACLKRIDYVVRGHGVAIMEICLSNGHRVGQSICGNFYAFRQSPIHGPVGVHVSPPVYHRAYSPTAFPVIPMHMALFWPAVWQPHPNRPARLRLGGYYRHSRCGYIRSNHYFLNHFFYQLSNYNLLGGYRASCRLASRKHHAHYHKDCHKHIY